MARNVQLQNKDEINVYPKTYAKNVYFNDGKTLEDKITELLNGENIIFEPYQLQPTSRYSLGGMIVGSGLEVDEKGVVSVKDKSVGVYSCLPMMNNATTKTNIYTYAEV